MIHTLVNGINTIGEGRWTEIHEAYNFPSWMGPMLLKARWRSLRFNKHVAFNGQKWILRSKVIKK